MLITLHTNMPHKRMHTLLRPTARWGLNFCEQQTGGSRGHLRRNNSPRRTRIVLLLAMVSVWAVPTAAAQRTPSYEPHVVVVQFEPGTVISDGLGKTGLQVFDRRAAAYNMYTIERVYPFLDHVQPTPKTRRNLLALRRTYFVRYSANVAAKHVARVLTVAPGVVYAEPVIIHRIDESDTGVLVDPNDPLFSDQTYLRHLRLTEAWDEVKGEDESDPVVIANVGGGGEWRHEDLRENVWTNPNETAGNGVDDDNNGFIDDVHGVNFANGDFTNNDPTGLPQSPSSANHGTAAAGAANAVTNNGVGVAGAAWNAEVMHINSGCPDRDGGICYGYQGVLYAAATGADIINASWGGLRDGEQSIMFVTQSLDLATDMGALVVASAGNSNLNNDLVPRYPARHPRVLSVGATNKDTRTKAGSSNFGKLVNVFAPGVSILTTGSNSEYVATSGTSFSAPLTAGVAALVKTKFPAITPDALREQVRLASENMDAANPGLTGHLGRGFVNALEAIKEPTVPSVRLKRWSWIDSDGNGEIASGDQVTITATVVNYLADAQDLTVALAPAGAYPFIDMTTAEVNVGSLPDGDSTEVTFEFVAASSAPTNQRVRFYLRSRDGAYEDEADMITLGVNRSLDAVHQSLSALYTSTGGNDWRINANWDITTVPSEEELSSWYGVFLSEGFLVSLDLDGNNLNGPLPAELGILSQLTALHLQNNSLSGEIPSELGNLSQLARLSLHGNSLSGPVPSELGNLSQLSRLSLYGNSLSGSLPSELGNLSQLSVLYLGGNSLSGSLPSELGNLSQLTALSLYRNSLSGPIPSELGNLSQLSLLSLYRNSLSGEIPSELGSLSQLSVLYLGGNSLSGSLPSWLGNLSQLTALSLYENSLSGEIPSELGNLSQLTYLNLRENSLSGPIPSELGNLLKLTRLYLQDNVLSGRLPRSLMQLDTLQYLFFGGQDLCAPEDDAFQAWLSSIPNTSGPTCSVVAIGIDGSVVDQTFTEGIAITPLVLPEAVGGTPPYVYALDPALPAGLVFDDTTRTITGAPTMTTDHATYTYTVADVGAMTASLSFGIEVVSAVSFPSAVADQSFPRAQPIVPLVLPAAMGGAPPTSYALTPALPAGLTMDTTTLTISGTPTVVTAAVSYTFKATGANGSSDSLMFSIEVYFPTDAQRETLPTAFALRGNYPNPFQHTTQIVFDLPWPAEVTVDVLDVLGRRMLSTPSRDLAGGWGRSISLSGATLPAGLYMYRVHASAPEGDKVHVGRFVRIK